MIFTYNYCYFSFLINKLVINMTRFVNILTKFCYFYVNYTFGICKIRLLPYKKIISVKVYGNIL